MTKNIDQYKRISILAYGNKTFYIDDNNNNIPNNDNLLLVTTRYLSK